MTEKLTTYDPAAALVDDEEIAAFMADAFETGDAAYVAKALGVVARAKGMTESRAKQACLANSFIDRSACSAVTQRSKLTLARYAEHSVLMRPPRPRKPCAVTRWSAYVRQDQARKGSFGAPSLVAMMASGPRLDTTLVA